jgi:HSP20 family molecular chaperone IbpA
MEVGSVIKKQDNPYDAIFPALTEILAEIIRNVPDHQRVRVTGFFLVSPGSSTPPMVFRLVGEGERRRLPYEVIESDNFIFITARLPSDLKSTPHVEIMQDALHVFVDERVAVIMIQTPVDVIHSHFTVHHGVLDVTLKKIKKT